MPPKGRGADLNPSGRRSRQRIPLDAASNRLTLHLDGPRVTADKFRKAMEGFFGLLDEVAESVTGKKRAVEWIVSVREGSLEVNADPVPRKAGVLPKIPVIRQRVISGLSQLEKSARRPRDFSDDALESARDLASVSDGKNIEAASLKHGSEVAVVGFGSVEHVERLLGIDVSDYGSIEGRLEMLSARGKLHFAVYRTVDDQPVRCEISEERIREARDAFKKRVIVSGRIRYHKGAEFRPARIEVEEIFVIPSEENLPSEDEVVGMLGKLT